ncbi:MAG: T9SS type A sorting domain-containing protein [Bacteroidota bacterium]
MKILNLLLAAWLCGFSAMAQMENFVSETGGVNDPIVYVNTDFPDSTPCGVNNDSNAFENGKSCTRSLSRIVANDIIVPGGEDLTLERMTVNMFIGAQGSGVYASVADVFYYANNNGAPGTLLASESNVYIVSQTVVGSNFGFDIWQIELDVTDRVFNDQGGNPKTYWIGLSMDATDGSNLFWENSTLGLTGHGEAYDNGSSNFAIDTALEGVYYITADCVPRLGVEDNLANNTRLYPNPVTDGLLNVDSPLSGTLQIEIFDLSGSVVFYMTLSGPQLDISELPSGLYLLRLTQDGQSANRKIVVQ